MTLESTLPAYDRYDLQYRIGAFEQALRNAEDALRQATDGLVDGNPHLAKRTLVAAESATAALVRVGVSDQKSPAVL